MTRRIRVSVGEGYDVVVGEDLAHVLTGALEGWAPPRVVLAHTPNVAAHAQPLRQAITSAGMEVLDLELPDGEQAKDLAVVSRVWDQLGAAAVGRDEVLVAVGGGALTDAVGFVAATWLRGVRVVHVPTTMLGMVDAAIGGKTAIDTPAGKNLVGAFHQPSLVLCDLLSLRTLPRPDLVAGLAEAVKAGLVGDPQLLDLLEENADAAAAGDLAVLLDVVERAVRVKADVVSADERESGRRAILNYGHTLAHAIEHETGFGTWRHGDAVAVGMCFAAAVGTLVGTTPPALRARQREVLARLGLPTTYDGGSDAWAGLRAAMGVDKKSRAGRLRLVVLSDVGSPVLLDDPPEQLLLAAYAEVSG